MKHMRHAEFISASLTVVEFIFISNPILSFQYRRLSPRIPTNP